ncbi:hypothetical protein [Mycolicibacterium fluoranthenivorans]|uniref:Uncharacterized protein n=1 Tax=Mycolicibacterium fluoranthenivorans TaxID=258505 RepID=A0A1G4WKP5_9MYCO|nr:hypothetical protein [Mycolicibacterium fluoranthenivorans]SCX24777.1 hypothetical protein SAMN02799620_03776 [Mycolicibacterium fluoranthenivorans]
MTKHKTLSEAMDAKDDLAEAEIRYRLLAETFEEKPQLRANLNPALERAKAEILRLRAVTPRSGEKSATLVAFDVTRFRKSGPDNRVGSIG